MATNFRKTLSLVLALVLCMGMFSTVAMAGTWNGGKVVAEIKKGEDGYEFQSVYQSPAHAYEMSGHMVSTDGGVSNDIPQTLVMVPADSSYTFTPNGEYNPHADMNYEVLYCCDAETGYDNSIHYKRVNLEDSTYYTPADANKIRAIVSIAYPFKTMDEMKSILKEKGFAQADQLTRGEVISAVQAAIWYFANKEEFTYSKTFDVASNSQWGSVMHDYGAEGYDSTWWTVGTRKFTVNNEVGDRINALRAFLLNLAPVTATEGQLVITKIEVVETAPVKTLDGTYNITLNVALNHAPTANDNVGLVIKVNGVPVKTIPVSEGEFAVKVNAENNSTIEAVLSGTQVLDTGVYFYEPQGGRDISQSLVGVAKGPTAVHAEASVILAVDEPENPEFRFPKGGASNVSYMLIAPNGKVEFVKKVDVKGSDPMPIITKEGYASAMFIKQSTSGKFWISCEVDDEVVENVIKCLKANNKSYKGHDEEIAFGYGTHILTYTKGKNKVHTIPYYFGE